MTVKFQDPPPDSRGQHRYDSEKSALRANPGKWGLLPTVKNPSQISGWKRHGFEVTSRKKANGGYDVYARYVGGGA